MLGPAAGQDQQQEGLMLCLCLCSSMWHHDTSRNPTCQRKKSSEICLKHIPFGKHNGHVNK